MQIGSISAFWATKVGFQLSVFSISDNGNGNGKRLGAVFWPKERSQIVRISILRPKEVWERYLVRTKNDQKHPKNEENQIKK